MMNSKYEGLSDKEEKTLWKRIAIFIVIAIIIGISVIYPMIQTDKPLNVSVDNKVIKVNGWGNASINMNEVKEVKLLKTIPNVDFNEGGGSMDNRIFGNECLSSIGTARCFVQDSNKEAIYIKTKDKQYVINFKNQNETLEILKEIKKESV